MRVYLGYSADANFPRRKLRGMQLASIDSVLRAFK